MCTIDMCHTRTSIPLERGFLDLLADQDMLSFSSSVSLSCGAIPCTYGRYGSIAFMWCHVLVCSLGSSIDTRSNTHCT